MASATLFNSLPTNVPINVRAAAVVMPPVPLSAIAVRTAAVSLSRLMVSAPKRLAGMVAVLPTSA